VNRTRIRILIAGCAAFAMLCALATVSSAADKKLYATMTGKQEKPAGDPDGVGTAVLTVKSKTICFDIRPKKAGITFAAGHIHVGAAGKPGDVVVPLFQAPKKVKAGKLTGCSPTVAASLLAKIKAKPGGYYVNIHNAKYPAGAIRGQLTATKPA
jgi:hypothetical protein